MKQSQREMILKDLKRGATVSPILALNNYGCFRLAARINELKQEGYKIRSHSIVSPYTGKRYAVYRLEA